MSAAGPPRCRAARAIDAIRRAPCATAVAVSRAAPMESPAARGPRRVTAWVCPASRARQGWCAMHAGMRASRAAPARCAARPPCASPGRARLVVARGNRAAAQTITATRTSPARATTRASRAAATRSRAVRPAHRAVRASRARRCPARSADMPDNRAAPRPAPRTAPRVRSASRAVAPTAVEPVSLAAARAPRARRRDTRASRAPAAASSAAGQGSRAVTDRAGPRWLAEAERARTAG